MICMYWGNYNNTSMLFSLLEPKPKLLNHTKVTLLGDYHSNKVAPILIQCSWNQPVLGNESSFVLTETTGALITLTVVLKWRPKISILPCLLKRMAFIQPPKVGTPGSSWPSCFYYCMVEFPERPLDYP